MIEVDAETKEMLKMLVSGYTLVYFIALFFLLAIVYLNISCIICILTVFTLV